MILDLDTQKNVTRKEDLNYGQKLFYLESENLILRMRAIRLDWIKLFLNIASSVV